MRIVGKNRKRFNTSRLITLAFFLLCVNVLSAQDSTQKRPPLTKKLREYNRQVNDDSTKEMVELKSRIPGIVYDLRYATLNNFMHRLMYPAGTSVTFLRRPAADSLLKVQQELNQKGIGIKIFDAYRPYSVTVKFWELVHDERYVANPARGSGHNRGTAVDLTLIYLNNHRELNMGTGFDNFTDSAHHAFTQLPDSIMANRRLLKSTMEKYGFRPFATEWWHYFIPDQTRFEVLDIEFKKMKKLDD